MTGPRLEGRLLKLTTYFGERDRAAGGLLADALLDLYASHRIHTSLLVRGSQGFGRLHHLRSDRLLSLSDDLPVVSVAVDARERIEQLLPELTALQTRGLITLERASALELDAAASMDHDECKLTVYLGRRQRAAGRPAFVTVCELLHRHGLAGATVLLGVDGTRGEQRSRARFVGHNAQVPVMVISVGPADRVRAAIAALRTVIQAPDATIERVRVCKRDGVLLATPATVDGHDERGFARWQKLSVYSSQHAVHDGRPVDLELVRRLRAGDCAGATSLRGIWGFHGDHPPHGDKLLQVRRHVPVLTVTVDTPERSARAFEAIDAVTDRTGLVTSETVPALRAMSAERSVGGLGLARRER